MSHSQTLPAVHVPASTAPAKPRRKGQYRNLPLRDERGELRAIMEVAPSSTPDQRARFKALAQTLHQLWFIERPSPLSTGTGSPAPAPLTDPTDPIITQEAL